MKIINKHLPNTQNGYRPFSFGRIALLLLFFSNLSLPQSKAQLVIDEFNSGSFSIQGPNASTTVNASSGIIGGSRSVAINENAVTTRQSTMSLNPSDGFLIMFSGNFTSSNNLYSIGWGNYIASTPLNLNISAYDRVDIIFSQAPNNDQSFINFSLKSSSITYSRFATFTGAGTYSFSTSGLTNIDGIGIVFSGFGMPANATYQIESIAFIASCTPPALTAPSVSQPSCVAPNGGSITVNAIGNGALEYSIDDGANWSPSATFNNLTAGNYKLKVRLQANPTCITVYSGNPVVLSGGTSSDCCPSGNTLFVNAAATGANNGKTWTDAFTDLQSALNSPCTGITQIWVAKGTYTPTSTSNRSISFVMKNGIAIYGGFKGTEATLSERNWVTNVTTLSGFIAGGQRSYHVINNFYTSTNQLTSTAVLDGFTVTGGLASGSSTREDVGGGMHNEYASPTIKNCIFTNNTAQFAGGGIANFRSAPNISYCTFTGNSAMGWVGGGVLNYRRDGVNLHATVTHCTFTGNTALYGGGGMSNRGGFSNNTGGPTVSYCTFSNNSSTQSSYGGGGGMNNDSVKTSISHCIFRGNSSPFGGGLTVGTYGNGASYCLFEGNTTTGIGGGMLDFSTNPSNVVNCSFIGNTASDGGGIAGSSLKISNCSFSGNSATGNGGGIWGVNNKLTNCILWGNNSEIYSPNTLANNFVNYSIVKQASGVFPGVGNLNVDPLFVDPASDLHLKNGSPAINAGTATGAPTDDYDGDARPFGGGFDMGYDEATCVASTAPLSISGISTICNGESTTLTLMGGSAGTGAVAKWYLGTCGGTPVGTGNSITVSPTTNTTYFVRYEGTCGTTDCAAQLVSVNTISTPSVSQPTCAAPSSGSITVNATGSSALEYSIDNGTSWSPTVTFNNLSAGNYNLKVRLQANPSCITTYLSNPVVLNSPFSTTSIDTWRGCVSTDWNTAGNWQDGSVPTATDNVTIPNVVNDPVIAGITAAVAKSVVVQAGAMLIINAMGSLAVNGSSVHGLDNYGVVNNSGTILVGNTSAIGAIGILHRNGGTFNNKSGGSIQIDRTGGSQALYSNGLFNNEASMVIGSNASVNGEGIRLGGGTFNNNLGGDISINRASFTGITNFSNFINSAILTIGNIAFSAQDDIQNQGNFTNKSTGVISVDRGNGNGIWHLAGTFQNDGKIIVGSIANKGTGILCTAPFSNNAGAEIHIDRTPNGIANTRAFTNAGLIQIGDKAPLRNSGIVNVQGGLFNNNAGGDIRIQQTATDGLQNDVNSSFFNNACAKLTIFDNLNNNGIFTNSGLFTVNTSQTHTNTALTNNGIIEYPQANPIPNVTNNDLVVASITGCNTITPALQISGMNSFNVGTNWYKDQALTQVAGTYNQGTNTFTATNLVAGSTYQLYFSITDPVNSCTETVSINVTLNPLSTAPLSISGISTICNGGNTTLTMVGGSAGTGATAKWYSSTCGGTPVGTGNSISVSPTANTTYFVRHEGTCNTTDCAAQSITVNTLSTTPLSISGISTICNGGNTTLSMVGGSAGTGATAKWYSGSCGGTPEGTGNSISVSPTTNTTYFVRYEGTCGTTDCATQLITVNMLSTAPLSISGIPTICNGESTTLTMVGGSAGTGATAKWYSGSCGGTPEGTGNSISVSPTSNTTYFVRYEGTCNTTACAAQLITVNTLSTAPLSISGISTICNGGSTTLTMVGGSAGTGATAKWYSSSCGGTFEGTGNSISVYPTSNTTYFVRYEGTCNTTACVSVTVTINFPSLGGTLTPSQTTICGGTAVQLTLTTNSGTISKWEKQENCTGSWTSIGSGGIATLSLTPLVSTCYRVKTTNGVCPATNSSVATITVDQPAVGGIVSLVSNTSVSQASICSNQFAFIKASNFTGVIAGWQSNPMNSPVWRDIPNTANQVNLTVNGSNVVSTIFYRVKIYTTLGICTGVKSVAYSNAFKVSKKANCGPPPPVLAANEGVPTNPLTLVKAYPIPSNSRITLEINGSTEGVTQIEILDLTGKVVQRSSQNVLDGFNELTLDIQNLTNGFYLVKVKDSSNQEAVLKVSKM